MAESIESLKKENESLKKELELYKKDATYRGYYVQNKIVNQQIDILEQFNLKDEIKSNPKEDKYYDRAMKISEGMPDTIIGLNKLKVELKITGNEDRDKKNVPLVERLAETRT